ncbi:MAG: rhomboid family intramembrane serine protease [Pirellulaceae bacterium]
MSTPQNFPRPHHPGPRGDGSGALYGPPLSPPRNRNAEFARLLVELTPRVYVTPVLIGVNVLVFVAMALSGVSLTSPAIADLLLWGANFGPKALAGEWWRLLTCMFIHIGIVHILLNMWVLYSAGPLVERMVGNVGFLLMYLTAGLCGSVASLFWNPVVVSAGASGAVFGVFGCLLALVLRGKGSIPTETLKHLRSSGFSFLVINLVFGMMMPNIGMAAHLGGLAGGFLCGLVLSHPFSSATRAGRPLKNLLVAFLGTLLVVGGALGVQRWHVGL